MTVPTEIYQSMLTDPGHDLYESLVVERESFLDDLDFHIELENHYKGKTSIGSPYFLAVVCQNTQALFGGRIVNDKDRLLHLFCTQLKPSAKQLKHAARKVNPDIKLHIRIAYPGGWVEGLVTRKHTCYIRKFATGKFVAVRYDASTDIEHTAYYGCNSSNLAALSENHAHDYRDLVTLGQDVTNGDPLKKFRLGIFKRNTRPDPFGGVEFNAPHVNPNDTYAFTTADITHMLKNPMDFGFSPGPDPKPRINGFMDHSRDLFIDSDFLPKEQLPVIIRDPDGEAIGARHFLNFRTKETFQVQAVRFDEGVPSMAEAFLSFMEKNSKDKPVVPTCLIFNSDNFLVLEPHGEGFVFAGKYQGFSCRAYFYETPDLTSLRIVNSRGDMHVVAEDAKRGYQEYIWSGVTCDLITAGSHGNGVILSSSLMIWYKQVLCLPDVPIID